MAGTIGKLAADTARNNGQAAAVSAIVRRKLQEMQRELLRLGGAIQQVEHQLRAGGTDEFAWTQPAHQLRGWVLSLVESQTFIDTVGNADNLFETKLREVMAVAKTRAKAERHVAGRK